MIQITAQHRLILKVEPVDFRKGIDGLVGLCRTCQSDPFSGSIFVFRNRRCNAVKMLVYDGTGFWLCHKRFSQGKLRYWPSSSSEHVCATTMVILLNQGVPTSMAPAWRSLPGSA